MKLIVSVLCVYIFLLTLQVCVVSVARVLIDGMSLFGGSCGPEKGRLVCVHFV